jgi:Domain of unknown function (DUF4287)
MAAGVRRRVVAMNWRHDPGQYRHHLQSHRRSVIVAEPVQGPASYFPSIEKKYGRPISQWQELIRSSPLTKHMELVGWLKSEHGLGHGHANALVAHTLAENRTG